MFPFFQIRTVVRCLKPFPVSYAIRARVCFHCKNLICVRRRRAPFNPGKTWEAFCADRSWPEKDRAWTIGVETDSSRGHSRSVTHWPLKNSCMYIVNIPEPVGFSIFTAKRVYDVFLSILLVLKETLRDRRFRKQPAVKLVWPRICTATEWFLPFIAWNVTVGTPRIFRCVCPCTREDAEIGPRDETPDFPVFSTFLIISTVYQAAPSRLETGPLTGTIVTTIVMTAAQWYLFVVCYYWKIFAIA